MPLIALQHTVAIAISHVVWCLQNTEEWESEKTLADMEQYFWDINESRTRIVSLIKARKEVGLSYGCCHCVQFCSCCSIVLQIGSISIMCLGDQSCSALHFSAVVSVTVYIEF